MKKRKTLLPKDFTLTAAMRAFAEGEGYEGDIKSFFEYFCDKCRSDGRMQADWQATFRNWLRNEMKWKNERRQNLNREKFTGSRRASKSKNSGARASSDKYDGIGKELPA